MSEIQSEGNGTVARKRSVLKWAIGGAMLIGVAAVLYVMVAASFKPASAADLNEFKKGSLAKL
ncbi:TlpA family protein disulfide reductase, partial [Pseudomonas sp. HMWF010]